MAISKVFVVANRVNCEFKIFSNLKLACDTYGFVYNTLVKKSLSDKPYKVDEFDIFHVEIRSSRRKTE